MIGGVSAYIISLIIAFAVLIFAMTFLSSKENGPFLVLIFIITIVVLGYYKLTTAKTLEEAILAKQFTYIDGTLTSFIMLSCIMRLCKFKMPKWFTLFSMCYSILLLLLALTYNKSTLFAYDCSISIENGVTVLHKTNGPLHILFTIGIAFYMALILIVVIKAMTLKSEISFIHSTLMGSLVIIDVAVYFLERLFHINIELLPFAYNLTEIVLIIIIVRIDHYEISRDILSSLQRTGEHGYVVFDANKKFVGKDDTAVLFFPELHKLEIDRTVKEPFVLEEFIGLANDFDNNKAAPRFYERLGKKLKCTVSSFSYGYFLKNEGYLIEILDDTEQQEHIETLNKINEDLKVAVEDAKRANEEKSKFFSNMSHEIRTPINAINGMTEMILRESNQPSIIEYAGDVKSSSNMLLALVNDVLDFSKMEAGKMELNVGDYKLIDVIHAVDVLIHTRASDKGLSFDVEIDPQIPATLCGDEMRIKQIMLNLLSNAVKYTDKGSIHTKIGFEKIDAGKILLKISVEDTGRGIKPESIGVVFDSYRRIDENKNSGIEGTGLGMTITKQFVDLMNGRIWVESVYGSGSTFFVEIPQFVSESGTFGNYSERKEEKVKPADVSDIVFPGLKILLVDDTKMNRKVFAALLKNTQIEIDLAASGEEAIEMCHNNRYHMIFMDHMMPVMDGIECFEAMCADEKNLNRGVPVIMLTANALAGMREMYIRKGFSDYVAKPFQFNELVEMINKHKPSF